MEEMDFVSESTKAELLRLENEFAETQNELAELEKKYIGQTPAQQETLNKLKQTDLYYQVRVRTLKAKLAYIQAAYDEVEFHAAEEQETVEKYCYDAYLDSMDSID